MLSSNALFWKKWKANSRLSAEHDDTEPVNTMRVFVQYSTQYAQLVNFSFWKIKLV